LAAGDKVSDVTAMLEKEVSPTVKLEMDENDAVLAFSDTLPGNDNEPKLDTTTEAEKLAEKRAQKELDELDSNDATMALGSLVQ